MFKEYTDLLEEILCMEEDDIPEFETNIMLLKEQLEELDNQINEIKTNSLGENSPHIRKLIAEEAKKIEENYQSRLRDLRQKQQSIAQQEAINRENLLANIRVDKQCETTLKLVYAVIEKYKEKLSPVECTDLCVPIETYKQLKGRSNVFEKHFEIFNSEAEPFCKRVAEKISLREIFTGIENPKVSLCLMSGYLLVWLFGILYLPIVAVLGYTGMTVISVKDALKLRGDKYSLERELFLLEKSYENLEKSFKDNFQSEVDNANKQADADYKNALENYTKEEKELQDDYNKLLEELRIMESDPNFRADKLSFFRKRVDNLERERENYVNEIESVNKDLKDMQEELEGKKKELEELRKQIEDQFVNNCKPGTSRILTTELFLGFEKDGYLRTFDFNGKSTLIIYSGQWQNMAKLNFMIFLEILKTTNISALSFYVFDTEMGAPDFAPFTQEDLSDVVKICSTKEQCTTSITRVHGMLEERNKNILAYSDNILTFNKEMLAKNSLTREYVIILAQESSGAILNNPQFQQLCKAGPRVGIIPFVFIQAEWFTEHCTGVGKDVQSCYDLLSSINDNWFAYGGESDKLIKREDSFIRDNLKRLRSYLDN